MQFSSFFSRSCIGMRAISVKVEVSIHSGLPQVRIVGLPQTAVRESCHRVRAAICGSGFQFPSGRVTINLAPGDSPKEGSRFDLPIALGVLAASGQIPPTEQMKAYEFVGELSLDGKILPAKNIIASVTAAKKDGRGFLIPCANALEAGLIGDTNILEGKDLLSVYEWLTVQKTLPTIKPREIRPTTQTFPDFADIYGQPQAVRALEVAISGGHNCLFLGAPGSGKTMLAMRTPSIMPPLSKTEALEVATIYSLNGAEVNEDLLYHRPFRSPHHTASTASLVGGGSIPKPGEISKSHQGILFLDELPEFPKQGLEALREPLETGKINISRASGSYTFPAGFQLIAAMNPCPNGEDVDKYGNCPCSPQQLKAYYKKISAAILDRIDMQIRVPRVEWGNLDDMEKNTRSSDEIRKKVITAQRSQITRQHVLNARLTDSKRKSVCHLSLANQNFLFDCVNKMKLSARACMSVLKVSRTIADLAKTPNIERTHLLEALSYRSLTKLFKLV